MIIHIKYTKWRLNDSTATLAVKCSSMISTVLLLSFSAIMIVSPVATGRLGRLARSNDIHGLWAASDSPSMISIPQQAGPSESSVWTGWPRCTADDANASQLFCFHAVGAFQYH